MPWPFRRNPTKTQFGRDLLTTRERWEATVEETRDLGEPNRVVLLAASAGATVAFGGYGAAVQDQFKGGEENVPTGDRDLIPDRVVQFARSLSRVGAIEAAYRVLTWAFAAQMAAFFWRPNYADELARSAEAFGLNNIFEETVLVLGEPVEDEDDKEQIAERRYELIKGSLVCMVAAALDEEIDPHDAFVAVQIPAWLDQFKEGEEVASDRLTQLAPRGLPIWEE